MNITEDPADQRLGGVGVSDCRPIRARDLALLHGLLPQAGDFLIAFGAAEALDAEAVTPVERLLQAFSGSVMPARRSDRIAMEFMVGRSRERNHLRLDQGIPQLAR